MKNMFLVLTLGSAIALFGCKKDNDEEAPVIGEVRINGALAGEPEHVDAGTTIEVSIRVTDNEELAQLKIDIHSNDDGHSHDGDSHGSGGAQGEWEELAIVDLSGVDQTVTRSFTLPQTIRGEWHLSLRAVDSAGNESPERIIELDVENDLIPSIEVESVNGQSPNGEVEVEENQPVTFVGTITDAAGLEHIHIEVKTEAGVVLFEVEYEASGATSWDLSNANFTLPEVGVAVHGEIHIEAENVNGLSSEMEIELHFEL